jgi:hypothetical protein
MLFSMGGPYPSQVERIEKVIDVEAQEITFYIHTLEDAARSTETETERRVRCDPTGNKSPKA